MTDKTYSTGQVSGMTNIPIRTIQDYVKAFRDYFSEAARQPAKGRKFTDADIKTLLTIKRARSMRVTDDDIKKIFSGEIVLPLATEYNEDDIKQIAINAVLKMEIAEKLLNDCETRLANMTTSSQNLWSKVREQENTIAMLKDRADKFREWQIFMMKYDPDFNPYAGKKEPEPVNPEKKKGLFSLL